MFNKDREDKIKGLEAALSSEKERADEAQECFEEQNEKLGQAILRAEAEKERAERLSVAVDMKERTIKALTESVSVRRQTEERIKAEKRAEAAAAMVAECERDHPPEPEYLAWQAAGKPDAGEVSRLREELDEYKTKWAPIIREYLEPKR
jgi:chromosome segregation ATPase